MKKLSAVLAVRNEEKNLSRCLEAVKGLADEIIIVDEYSTDNTVAIAKKFGAKVFEEKHHDNFHITKQIAIDKATGEWILQLDADEVVSPQLAEEIKKVISMQSREILGRQIPRIFIRHQRLLEQRDLPAQAGGNTNDGEVVAFFIPRRNIFLGKPLIHAGVYPDAVIRLIRRGKAHLPAKSVHEQMQVDGQVSWLIHDLLHYDSPTLSRYLARMNRYTDLHASELADKKISKNFWQFINYLIIKPKLSFINLYFRHAGFKDGIRGFLWSFFSSLHFPLAYFKYITNE